MTLHALTATEWTQITATGPTVNFQVQSLSGGAAVLLQAGATEPTSVQGLRFTDGSPHLDVNLGSTTLWVS